MTTISSTYSTLNLRTVLTTSKTIFHWICNSRSSLPMIPLTSNVCRYLNKVFNSPIDETTLPSLENRIFAIIHLPQFIKVVYPNSTFINWAANCVKKANETFDTLISQRIQHVIDYIFANFVFKTELNPEKFVHSIVQIGGSLELQPHFAFINKKAMRIFYHLSKGMLILALSTAIKSFCDYSLFLNILQHLPYSQNWQSQISFIAIFFSTISTAIAALLTEKEYETMYEGLKREDKLEPASDEQVKKGIYINHYQKLISYCDPKQEYPLAHPLQLHKKYEEIIDFFTWSISLDTQLPFLFSLSALTKRFNTFLGKPITKIPTLTFSDHFIGLKSLSSLNYYFKKNFNFNFFKNTPLLNKFSRFYYKLDIQTYLRNKIRDYVKDSLFTSLNTNFSENENINEFNFMMGASLKNSLLSEKGISLGRGNNKSASEYCRFIYHIAPTLGVCTLSLLSIRIAKLAYDYFSISPLLFGSVYYYFTSLVSDEVDYAFNSLGKTNTDYPSHDFVNICNSPKNRGIITALLWLFKEHLETYA
jgi:hypothetical protein